MEIERLQTFAMNQGSIIYQISTVSLKTSLENHLLNIVNYLMVNKPCGLLLNQVNTIEPSAFKNNLIKI